MSRNVREAASMWVGGGGVGSVIEMSWWMCRDLWCVRRVIALPILEMRLRLICYVYKMVVV